MLDKILFGSRLHESPDPALRVEGVQALPPDAKVLAQMLGDPVAEVRAAAAARCSDANALSAAMTSETEASVRSAIAAALGTLLAATTDIFRSISRLRTNCSCPNASRWSAS